MVSLIAEFEERDQSFPSSFTIFSQLHDIGLHTTWYTDWILFYIVSCSIIYFIVRPDRVHQLAWWSGRVADNLVTWPSSTLAHLITWQAYDTVKFDTSHLISWQSCDMAKFDTSLALHQYISRTLCALSYNYIQIIVAFTSVCPLSVCFKCDPNTN